MLTTPRISDATARPCCGEELKAIGLTYGDPQGGFTVLASIRDSGLSSEEFCLEVLREEHVQIFPGAMYGPAGEGYVRISMLAPIPKLREGLRRVGAVVERLRTARG